MMTLQDNACVKCEKHCCIGSVGTFITIRDAKRISDFLGISMDEFCFFGDISKDKKFQRYLMRKKFHSYLNISKTGKILQLKSKDNEECIFLKNRLCSIRPARPLVCKIFPLGYEFNGSICYFAEDEYCRLIGKDIEETCENIGLTIAQVKAIVKQHLQEVEEYKQHEKYFLDGMSVEELFNKINKNELKKNN